MKQRFFLVLGATVASLSLLMLGASCERHSWDETSKLHKPHGGHGGHDDHGGDHGKAEGDHGGEEEADDH